MINRIGKDEAHRSWHKYFIWADTMRLQLDRILLRKRRTTRDTLKLVMYRSLWYGMLYAVIEGIKRLNIKDSRINRLLKSRNTYLLEGFRHSVLHYQTEYHEERFVNFLNKKSTDRWVRRLHFEIGRYFIPQKFAVNKFRDLVDIRNLHDVR